MNLHRLLEERRAAGEPVRAGLIGAGKFGSMFLAQARVTPGLHVLGIADLDPQRARQALRTTGWDDESCVTENFAQALESGGTCLTDEAEGLIRADGLEVVIDATGHPPAGVRHARLAAREGRHMVMVNVEADVLAGPLLAAEAKAAGLVYSMAYGDQPALICEMVDWARACGLTVVAAGKGTKYLPEYHASTPKTVWKHFGITDNEAGAAGMNPKMFNSFVDGTKSGIEMAAVSNATALAPPPDGLLFPPSSTDELPTVLRPKADGGVLHCKGQVEVVSSLRRDGADIVNDLRWGVYVVFEAPSDYTARCFNEYGMVTDPTGKVSALYRPYHLIGLELGVSVLSAALRGEATGAATGFRADVVATAKRDLKAGEILDGEGGYLVWGKAVPAETSLRTGALPLGLAQGIPLTRPIAKGETLTWADVRLDESDETLKVRREMETRLSPPESAAAE